MKTRDLEKKLRAKGAWKIEEGAGHSKWVSKKGYQFTVPRHRETKEGLAAAILKQADM